MLNSNYSFRRVVTGAAVAIAACVLVVHASVPRGWLLAGTKPAEFEVGIDANQVYEDHASAFLQSKALKVDGFGTLMQSVRAEKYNSRGMSRTTSYCCQPVVPLTGGTGKVWLSRTKFDVVGTDVSITGTGERKIPDMPVNLEFNE
jgi:hypothetical protein